MLDEFTARNNAALRDLVDRHEVELRRLPDDVLIHLRKSSDEIMAELVAEDPMAAKIYASWKKFLVDVSDYHSISEQAYINARSMVREAEAAE
jgi:TRAP-type mannitol/chloroaromatic compound transport system substrate-binding protein